ncbi:hypothetical protein ACFY1L_38065 [Streptomyces sp. NPDC001663]|uniref:hypothetical protein n=1 Tax=Streptomyces sp. NPDC001663 TaxID=3364597 RepID=UPI0036BF8D2A
MSTPREEQPLLRGVASAKDAALLAEVVELRAPNEQLERALVSRAVIDAAALVATAQDEALPEPVRQELRQALRPLQSADRGVRRRRRVPRGRCPAARSGRC